MRTKAMVWDGANRPGLLEEVELAEPQTGEVLVKVAAAGVCHSDLHLAQGHLGLHRFPTVLGHEGAGVIEAVGAGVTEVDVGQHVGFCFIPACRECAACRRGQPNLCIPGSTAAFTGTMLDGSYRLQRGDGTGLQHFLSVACFAESAVVPVAAVVPVSPDIPLWQASLIGCAVVTGHGAVTNAARVQAGESICVIGCGGVGLQVVAAARLAGAGEIVAVDPVAEKRSLAMQYGATKAVSPDELDGSYDVVIEVVGRAETIELAWRVTRGGGTTVVVGIAPRGVNVAIPALDFSNEKTIRGSFYGSGDPAADISRLAESVRSGGLDLTTFVTHTTSLEGINEAFERMKVGAGARTIVLIDEELAGWSV